MKKLLSLIKEYRKNAGYAVVFMLIDVVCEVMQPTLMANIVGKGIVSRDIPYIITTGTIMIILAGLAIFAGFQNAKNSAVAGVGFAANLRGELFKKIQKFSFNNIDRFSTASLSTRVTNDVTVLQNAAIMSMRVMVRAPIMLVFALLMSIRMNQELAVVLLIVIPLLAIGLFIIIKNAMPLFGVMQAKVDQLNSQVRESLTNVRVVKSFVRQDYEKEKFRVVNDDLMQASLRVLNIVIINLPFMILIMNASVAAVIWFGGSQVINGTMDVGSMTAFINYITQILVSLMMLSFMFVMASRATASYKRIIEVLETEVDLTNSIQAEDAGRISGAVEFRNVSFKYSADNDMYAIKNISFQADPGQVVAIIGGTGSGKSSLVQLIPRLYDVTEGRVLIDNRDVRDLDIESLRKNIGVVLQNSILFSGTIRENLKWGMEDATDEEIVWAAKNAQAHDFIMNLPGGYDYRIEQGGVNVSGGQKQRICIARAMLTKPAILILDDSTSAVDTATEKKIRSAFSEDFKDTTTFIIAQRVSSVMDADKIIILEDGEISAVGTHAELLKNDKSYQELYYSQQESEVTA